MKDETTPPPEKDTLENTGSLSMEMQETTALPPPDNGNTQKEGYAAAISVMGSDDDDGGDNASGYDENGRRLIKISCHTCGQKLDLTPLEPFSHVNCPACGADLIVPVWFDAYLLEEPGGTGGMATVYRALDLALDREVAIKVLHPDLAGDSEKTELFLNEARAAAALNHSALIPIYTCGVFENQAYLVMQYMDGGSLENRLRNAPKGLDLPDVYSWIRDVAGGLENARKHGVVHHDIKPGNIMLDAEGHAKVGDFGLAQIANWGTAGEEKTGDALEPARSWVSPHYASPEKIRTGAEDFRGDIYSLGATFYQLVTGLTPFPEKELDELLRIRLSSDPMPPKLQRSALPERISKLILAMMDRDPEKRPGYPEIAAVLKEHLKPAGKTTGATRKPPAGKNSRPLPHPGSNGASASAPRKMLSLPPSPPAQKKSTPLWFLSNLMTIALVLCIIFVFADKQGYLDRFAGYLPEFMQKTKKKPDAEMVLNATIVQDFQRGNTASILKDGEANLQAARQRGKRIQAALQLCYAAFLENDPKRDPVQYSEQILHAIEPTLEAVEKIRFEDHLALIRYLAGSYEDPSGIENDCRFPHTNDFAAKKALAVLLYRFQTGKDITREERLELMNSFETALKELMAQRCWMYIAFMPRLPSWLQAVEKENGKTDEIEPLFRPLIKTTAGWETPPEIPFGKPVASVLSIPGKKSALGKTPDGKDSTGPDSDDGQACAVPEIAEDKIQDIAEKYTEFKRPRPEGPIRLITENLLWKYYQDFIKRIPGGEDAAPGVWAGTGVKAWDSPEESPETQEKREKMLKLKEPERLRINELLKLKKYLFELSVNQKHPCTLEDFAWENRVSYGPGTVVFYDTHIVFRKTGDQKNVVKLSWNNIPLESLLDCLKYYAEWRETIAAPASETPEQTLHRKEEQADAWIRFALLAAWYERYGEAADALRKAGSLCPTRGVVKRIEILFLK